MKYFDSSIINVLSLPEFGMVMQAFSIFLLVGCLFTIISNRRLIASSSYKRAINSFLFIVFIHLVTLIINLLVNTGNNQFELFVNILNKVIFGISSLWLIWLWGFPSYAKNADGIKYILTISLVITFIIQLYLISATGVTLYSLNFYVEALLFLLIFIILLSGAFLLIINHKAGWFWGFLFVLILITGFIFSQTTKIVPSKSAGILFLTQCASFILLPTIIQSLINAEVSPDGNQPGYQLPIANKDMSILPALNVYKSWLDMAIKNQDTLILNEFLKNISNTFQSDYCFLFSPFKSDSNQINIFSGYTAKRQDYEFPIALSIKKYPTLFRYLKNWKSCVAYPEDYLPEDISDLLIFLKIKQPVHILFYPIRTRLQPKNIFGLALLSSHTRWEQSHLKYLSGIDDELVLIMQKIFPKKIDTEILLSSIQNQSKTKQVLFDKIPTSENQTQKIVRLESELKLALEEYARIKQLLEERGIWGDIANKNR